MDCKVSIDLVAEFPFVVPFLDGRVMRAKEEHGELVPFGRPIGSCQWGIPAYSCDYNSAVQAEHRDHQNYHTLKDLGQICTGFKFQCVEYARRWLVAVKGHTFQDVGMANEVYSLPHFYRVTDMCHIPLTPFQNGATSKLPPVGAVILWAPRGYFRGAGHIAIVVGVAPDGTSIFVAEQSVYDRKWAGDRNYSRELPVTREEGDRVFIHDNHPSTNVLGWVEYE